VNVCIKNPFLMMMRGPRPQCYYFSRKREGGQFFACGQKTAGGATFSGVSRMIDKADQKNRRGFAGEGGGKEA
jgi:hypothetical protein